MGQYDEAVLALKSYLDLAEINLKVKSTVAEEVLTNEQRIRLDIESEYDITSVMVEGSRLYGKELGQATEALACAEKALSNIQQYLDQEEAKDLSFYANTYRGIAYGLQAAQGMSFFNSELLDMLLIYYTITHMLSGYQLFL